jgi:hypothetical protein
MSWVKIAGEGMFMVYTDGTRHSAWSSRAEAAHQKKVLMDHGYKDVSIEFEEGDYDNGHYFV